MAYKKNIAKAERAYLNGDYAQAEKLCRKELGKKNKSPEALYTLGKVLIQQKRYDSAVELMNDSVKRSPNDPNIWELLGIAYMRLNQFPMADQAFVRSLEIDPDRTETLNRAGQTCQYLKDYSRAEQYLRRALELNPEHGDACLNLGVALVAQDQASEAPELFEKALELKPDSAGAWFNLGNFYYTHNEYEKAFEHFKSAVKQDRFHAPSLTNMGVILRKYRQYKKALSCFHRVLQVKTNDPIIYNNIGLCYKDLNMGEKGIQYLRKALELQPHQPRVHSNLLLSLNYMADISRQEVFSEHLDYQEKQASRVDPLPAIQNRKDPDKVLCLGFVSADLKWHSVSYFLTPVIEHLNREEFEVYFYNCSDYWDKMTDFFKAHATSWVECEGMSDTDLAQRVREDRIDILVDLSGHTPGTRLMAFAAKPAPIQVTWLGYPNTTGLQAMDYRIVDAVTDPPGDADRFHSEKLVRMPHGFSCYRPPIPDQEVPVTAEPYSRNGYITFGSFNNQAKISPQTISMWAGVLKAVPESRLMLKSGFAVDFHSWSKVLSKLEAQGVDRNRVTLLQRTGPQADHFRLFGQVDIALDTFPYHGTTTTCEALHMGVPVIALAGDRHVSRVSASLLTSLGLNDLVAESQEDFIRIAAELASDKERLSRLRKEIRPRMQQGPLRDEQGFTRTLQRAFRQMWDLWCEGQEPRSIEVSADKEYDFSRITPVETKQPAWMQLPEIDTRPELVIRIKGEVAVAVPKDLSLLTPYVLLEQEDWCESEIDFVRSLVRPGMTVLDMDTGFGVYALSMARQLQGQGKVIALNHEGYFRRSLELNNLQELVQTQLQDEPLDFVRMDTTREVPEQGNPLLMFPAQEETVQRFKDQGLSIYEYVPGLNALVPLEDGTEMQGSLFACGASRAQHLSEQGLLIPETSTEIKITRKWQDVLSNLPYARPLFAKWQDKDKEPGLNMYLSSRDESLSLAQRYALLQKSLDTLADEKDQHICAAMTYIRVLFELGKKRQAARVSGDLVQTLKQVSLDRPFVPPVTMFDQKPVKGNLGLWTQAAIFEAYERSRADTSYHEPQNHMQLLMSLYNNPNHSLEMQRRLALCGLRLGKNIDIRQDSRLLSAEHLNASAWKAIT